MTQDEIIEMAKKAWFDAGEGWVFDGWFTDRTKAFEVFANLVAAKALAKEKALQALHDENERLGLYKDAYAQRTWVGLDYEPVCPECKAGVLYECVACSSNNYPPQRTWVGLTRIELIKCGVLPYGMSYELYQAIEAKLKQKNG